MIARNLFVTLTMALAACLAYSARAIAQVTTQTVTSHAVISQMNIENLPSGRSLDVLLQMDPKGGSTAVTVSQNGPITLPDTFVPPAPNTEVKYKKCKKGTLNFYGTGVKAPCGGAVLGSFHWGSPVTIDASLLGRSTGPAPNRSVSMPGFMPSIQLRGFGGATFVNGNTPATAGFDGAVPFPLGNRVLVGPTAGFQWVDSSIIKTIGGGPPPSTFINTSVGFKEGNFGGRIGFPFGGWEIGITGGATVAGSTITQATGFCGGTGGSLPPGCTVLSTTTTHDTVVGPFVAGYISHSIFSHLGVFVEYDYHRLKDTKSSVSVYDLHYSDVVAGLSVSFGRHQAK